jgi:hypothetical protein
LKYAYPTTPIKIIKATTRIINIVSVFSAGVGAGFKLSRYIVTELLETRFDAETIIYSDETSPFERVMIGIS